MRNKLLYTAVAILLTISWSSCLKDQCVRTFTMYTPVFRTTDEVRANMGAKPAREVQHPGKIYTYGRYIFLNDLDKGIHVIDNADPSHPVPVSFIEIAGCVDMAVKGNILYADAYTDLVVFDIQNPAQANLLRIVNGVFESRVYNGWITSDGAKVVTDWIAKDTTMTVDCGNGSFFGFNNRKDVVVFEAGGGCLSCNPSLQGSGGNSPFGMGGSMARFALINDYLYTVSTTSLQVFQLSRPAEPVRGKQILLNWFIETIYPFRDQLFIGSRSGMYLYSVSQPDNPREIGRFQHANACDPVVGDDEYAYITLRSGTACEGFNNELDIVSVKDPSQASLLMVYPMKNPHGLAKAGNLLFICDGEAGLKVYDARNVFDLKLLDTVEGIETFDVIAWQGIAIVTAKGGLFQYDYADPTNLRLLSKMSVPF